MKARARCLAVLLAALMVITAIPSNVLAANADSLAAELTEDANLQGTEDGLEKLPGEEAQQPTAETQQPIEEAAKAQAQQPIENVGNPTEEAEQPAVLPPPRPCQRKLQK